VVVTILLTRHCLTSVTSVAGTAHADALVVALALLATAALLIVELRAHRPLAGVAAPVAHALADTVLTQPMLAAVILTALNLTHEALEAFLALAGNAAGGISHALPVATAVLGGVGVLSAHRLLARDTRKVGRARARIVGLADAVLRAVRKLARSV
jgi:hypothetical protein